MFLYTKVTAYDVPIAGSSRWTSGNVWQCQKNFPLIH